MNTNHLAQKIDKLQDLKVFLKTLASDTELLNDIYAANNWYTPNYVKLSIENICNEYLDKIKLELWIANYKMTKKDNDILGLILAGNIPLVGFQDILCAYMSDIPLKIKLSSKDTILTKKVLDFWMEIDTNWTQKVSIVSMVKDVTKIIATGSNNSHQYFEFYFKKFHHILRKNRTSVAYIPKDITDDELVLLMDDIFQYYGLGCRNISKIYLQHGFDRTRLFEISTSYANLFHHQKYMNNYDYQRTLLLLNKTEHLANEFWMLRETTDLFSPISVIHYQWVDDIVAFDHEVKAYKNQIQCLISSRHIPYGRAHQPSLTDYPDGIDIMRFLVNEP